MSLWASKITAVLLGGNRGNGVNAGSRASNWNNYVWNSNWNIGVRLSCEYKIWILLSYIVTAYMERPYKIWSAYLSSESKYIERSVKVGVALIVKEQDSIKRYIVGKKYKILFEKIIDIDNLRLAYKKALKGGNRYTTSHLKFKENLEANLSLLQAQLESGVYRHGNYHTFLVYEPKERLIASLPFRDRVAQHAINNIVEPIFESMFYSTSYACRSNKGTHKGVKAVQAKIRKLDNDGSVYYLKMDFSKYFHSINTDILFREISKKISDVKVLNLLKGFVSIDSKGIPIGNLLSQLFANIYGHIFDRFVKTKLKARYYFRYMDDTVILSNCKKELVLYQQKLYLFIKLFMKLKFSKWYINAISKPLNFLGYRISQNYKLIRKDSVVRAKRKIKRYKKIDDVLSLKLFLASWRGHLRSADSWNLVKFINKEEQLCKMKLALSR